MCWKKPEYNHHIILPYRSPVSRERVLIPAGGAPTRVPLASAATLGCLWGFPAPVTPKECFQPAGSSTGPGCSCGSCRAAAGAVRACDPGVHGVSVPKEGQPRWGEDQCAAAVLGEGAPGRVCIGPMGVLFGSRAPPGRDGEAWLIAEAGRGREEPSGPGRGGERGCLQSGGG